MTQGDPTPDDRATGSTLEPRLLAAAGLISADVHADVGSDHASLPIWLLRQDRVARVVIVEKTPGPLEVARQAVARSTLQGRAELRLGDGLQPLHPPELDSVSLTGMGARTILGILERGRAAGRRPAALVVQPNDGAGLLRQWAGEQGYWLAAERLVSGFWRYPVLRLERHPGPDPAYAGVPLDAALRYGPHLLREAHPLLTEELQAQHRRLEPLEQHARPQVLSDLHLVRSALDWLDRRPG